MKTILSRGLSLSLGAALSLAAATAGAAELHPSATVTGDQIRLGDLFDGAGEVADRVVAPAPAPGRQISFDGEFLTRLSQLHHLDWKAPEHQGKVVVTRASRTVSLEDMRATVVEALTRRAVGGRLQVEFDNPGLQVVVPSSPAPVVTVDAVNYNPSQSRFTADVIVGFGGPAPQRVTLGGRAILMVEMPVLTRRVNPGEAIERADIAWVEFSSTQLSGNLAASETDLIERTPRRSLPVNAPINLYDIQAPKLVTRGQMVTMVLRTPTMLITTQGKATQDGIKGEVIRVTNVQSNRTIDATVTNINQVAVSVPGIALN